MKVKSTRHCDAVEFPQFSELPIYCLLEDEPAIPPGSMNARLMLYKQFKSIPQEVFSRLRHFQPQSGCFNKCSFCSQGAKSSIIEFSMENLINIIAVIKAVCLERVFSPEQLSKIVNFDTGHLKNPDVVRNTPLVANGREDKYGVIYCYLDNDPAIYSNIDEFARLLYDNLGVKTRIATVGFSRHNHAISRAFSNLSSTLRHCVAGVRLSISPYTYGWTEAGMRAGVTHRDEFEQDLVHFFTTFKGVGSLFSAELRFRPMIEIGELALTTYSGLHILAFKNFLYISDCALDNLPIASISDGFDHALKMDTPGLEVIQLEVDGTLENTVNQYLHGDLFGIPCLLHRLQNDDGIYFGINVERTSNGKCYAKFFYPKTLSRPNSGHIDGERYLLNAMIDTKSKKEHINWKDIDELILCLKNRAETLTVEFGFSSNYIINDIIPLVESYARVLKLAGYAASAFLDKELTVDTGQICNLGRAFHEYKSLASRQDLPMTPNHERAFGKKGDLANEGTVFRLAPGVRQRISSTSGRTNLTEHEFIIEELDLSSTSSENGQSRQRFTFNLSGNFIRIMKQLEGPVIIGQIPTRVIYE